MADLFCVCICFVIILVVQDVGGAIFANHPSSDFHSYSLGRPRLYHVREKRHISDTKQNGEHIDQLQITLEFESETMTLDLTRNKGLIPKGFFQKHQENGKNITVRPTKEKIDLCYYSGTVRGKPTSWVALSTCNGISGVIYDGKEIHYLEKDDRVTDSSLESPHFVYKNSDLVKDNNTSNYVSGTSKRYRRSATNVGFIHAPYSANKDSRYVELLLVVDNKKFKELGENKDAAVLLCKNIANILNGLYAPLNIFIALTGVVIWNEQDEIQFSTNGDQTLTNFLRYRMTKLNPEHPSDNAQLITKFKFDNGVVAKALKGPICTHEYSGGVNTDYSPIVSVIAGTIAHSLGHNFGMEHDTQACECPDDRCIMSPSVSTATPTHWSSCSLEYLVRAFSHGMDYCLRNKPQILFDGPVCGNGFVEPGEECDCGLPEYCNNTCCDGNTCRFHANASCANGECCDLKACKPKQAGTLCRSADYECDLPEHCTGQSEYCPNDVYKMDTEPCNDGEAFCYHGSCRTRMDQCKLLWGETGESSDDLCYNLNTKGSRHGNCGYNKFNQTFYKCEQQDIHCGMLQCKHLNERLEFGMESVSILGHSFVQSKGSLIPCRTAIIDLGTQQTDPGLTPDGAKCDEGMMCVDQKCKSIENLRKHIPSCPKNCSENGWCNNRGHCHCKSRFAPPLCESPGLGGSEDSGPVSDPNASSEGVIEAILVALKTGGYINTTQTDNKT